MTVYADILVLLNFLVDYFLLALTAGLLRQKISFFRQLIAALFGGFFALTIFLPEPPIFVRILLQIGSCAVMTGLAAAERKWRPYLRFAAVFFAVSCGYAGGMLALWYLLHPNGMVIHNSVVYFNISPLFLILFSVVSYFIILVVRGMIERSAVCAHRCTVTLFAEGRQIEVNAIADTGNSLEDVFGISEIIIADEAVAKALFGDNLQAESLLHRYRTLPCTTVSGTVLLDAWRCDKAHVIAENRCIELHSPIVAVSKTPLTDDYSAIINPKIIESF